MGKATFMKGKMLAKAVQAVEAGHIPEQIWMKAARRMEAAALVPQKVKKERQPEDPFIESYLVRHPEAEFIALDVSSSDHPARKFAFRQMEVMKAFNMKDRRLAREIVEAECSLEEKLKEECMHAERKKAIEEGRRPPSLRKSVLQKVHEEEVRHHLAGLRKMRRQYEEATASCTIGYQDAFPEARRWDERDHDYVGQYNPDFIPGKI